MANSLNGEFGEDVVESDAESFDESEGEVLLRSVFESCEVNNNGKVKVSTLLDHLLKEAAAEDNPKILGYLDELAVILDPSGKDITVDKEMYNTGIRRWIHNVQSRSSLQDFNDEESAHLGGVEEEERFGVVYRGRGEGDQNLNALTNGYAENSLESRSFYSSESSSEWQLLEKSQSEILGRIQDLQTTNRKLVDEKAKLRSQVDTTEEANSILSQEITELRNKLSRYDQLVEKNKSLEQDFEAIKNKLNEYRTRKDELTSRTSQLEKENNILQSTIEDYQKVDLAKNAALETVREENRELMQKLNEQKQLYVDLEVLQDLKQKIVDESSSKSEYMTSFIAELSMANEALKAEKNRLEVDLLESKHEISKLTAMRSPSSMGSREPIYASTPFNRDAPVTLQQEMRSELASSNLSTTSRECSGRLSFADSTGSRNYTHESGQSNASGSTAASSDKYSSVAQQIALNFKKKKDLALKQIAELAAVDPSSDQDTSSNVLIKKWEEGLDSFTSEIEGLAVAKQQAERRSAKLLVSLEKVRAENKKLTESREKALQKIGDISISGEEMEQRVNELIEDIQKEKAIVEELRTENEKLKMELEEEQEKKQALQEELDKLKKTETFSEKDEDVDAKSEAVQRIKDLTDLVANLESRDREHIRKVFELEETLEVKENTLQKRNDEIKRLENSLSETVAKHENSLRDILEMFPVQGDLLPESELPSQPAELLKGKFERCMAAIKLKLQNMSVRDGPIGSEGNDAPSSLFSENIGNQPFPNTHFELGSKISKELNAHVVQKDSVCVACQTDLGMREVEEAIRAVTMLKALQEIDDATASSNDCFGAHNELHELEKHSHAAENLTENNRDTDLAEEIHESPGEVDSIENRNNSRSDGFLRDQQIAKENSASRIPGLKVNHIGEKDKHLEDVDILDQLIFGKPKEQSVVSGMRGIVDGSHERCAPKLFEVESKAVEKVDNTGEEQRTTKEKPSRNLLLRSDSVSTDESNTSDEMGIETLDFERKVSTKSEVSEAVSESSTASLGSKRARRIGVSAEPVRLPTWTELRESIKLNQQIFLEEEMNQETEGLMRTPRNSLEGVYNIKVTYSANNNINMDGYDIAKEKDAALDASDAANASMEWWYEVPKDQQEQGVDSSATQPNEGSVSMDLPRTKISSSSSAHSNSGESYQTLRSNESSESKAGIVEESTVKHSSKLGDSVEEEKGGGSSPDNRGLLNSSRKNSKLVNEEQHPHMSNLEKDLEKRYNAAVLSFRTDQYTLQRRLENQERARDVAESGMEREIRKLHENLQAASKVAMTFELKEIITNLERHIDILRKAGMKVSAQAEQHGCFQQESKIAPTLESLIGYAEHLQLRLERSKEADDSRIKELVMEPLYSIGNDANHVKQKYSYCEKCRGALTFEEDNINESDLSKEEKSKKSNSSTFFGLASSILRERKNDLQKKSSEVSEVLFQDNEEVSKAPNTISFAPNEKEPETTAPLRAQKSRGSYCECAGTILRFILSVAIMSAMLLLFAKYVEVDLPLVNKNWNDKLIMYGKRFFGSSNNNAV